MYFFLCFKLFPIVLVSIAQLVWTMHKICKVRDSNPGHHQKKLFPIIFLILLGHIHPPLIMVVPKVVNQMVVQITQLIFFTLLDVTL